MKQAKNVAFSINFRLNKQRVKNAKHAIYLRVTVGKQRAELATHQYIDVSQWDQKLQYARGKTDEAKELFTPRNPSSYCFGIWGTSLPRFSILFRGGLRERSVESSLQNLFRQILFGNGLLCQGKLP